MLKKLIKYFLKYYRKFKKTNALKYLDNTNAASHTKILEFFHTQKTPKTYIEIGVQEGHSIVLANKRTKTIGIDPKNVIAYFLNKKTKMFFMSSDDFFKKNDLKKIFKGEKIDLAFIDGMHLFEYTLRDFINVEKNCHKDSTIILHDTIPLNKETSGREILKGFWTGDVFKVILILKKYRPELKLYNFDKIPGACIVKNVDPGSSLLKDNYDKILQEYIDLTFDDISSNINEHLCIMDFDKFEDIKHTL